MNAEVKIKWLAALRSGEYKQGTGTLRRSDDTYCCLGVLCDIHSKETQQPWVKDSASFYDYMGFSAGLCDTVKTWAELNYHNPTIIDSKERAHSLAGLNDQGGTFKEIANLIEEQF